MDSINITTYEDNYCSNRPWTCNQNQFLCAEQHLNATLTRCRKCKEPAILCLPVTEYRKPRQSSENNRVNDLLVSEETEQCTFLITLFVSGSWNEPATLVNVTLRPDLFSTASVILFFSPFTTWPKGLSSGKDATTTISGSLALPTGPRIKYMVY